MTEHRIDNAEVTAGSNRWSPGPSFLGLSWHPILKKLRWSAFEQLLSLLVAVVAVFLAVFSQFPTCFDDHFVIVKLISFVFRTSLLLRLLEVQHG